MRYSNCEMCENNNDDCKIKRGFLDAVKLLEDQPNRGAFDLSCTYMKLDSKLNIKIPVSIQEYNILKQAADFLSCLEECGVDNWEGYSHATELLEEY